MNHSGIARFTAGGIYVPEDVAKPLSFRDGSTVTGLYYPTPSEQSHHGIPFHHDFMFTLIPHHLWPYVARFKIHFRFHNPGAMARATQLMKARGVSILVAEAARCGHRYAAWTTTVDFQRLHRDPRDLQRNPDLLDAIFREVHASAQSLKDEMEASLGDDLFLVRNDPEEIVPIRGEAIGPLNYFFKWSLENPGTSVPFGGTYVKGGFIRIHESNSPVLPTVLDQLPTLGFVEMDTRAANMRVVAIPRQMLSTFAEATFSYVRTKPLRSQDRSGVGSTVDISPDSSLGLLSDLTRAIGTEFNLWRVFNQISQNAANFEKGELAFFMQYVGQPVDDIGQKWTELEQRLRGLHSDVALREHSAVVQPLYSTQIFLSARDGDLAEVKEICFKVGQEMGLLQSNFIVIDKRNHTSTTDEVIEGLLMASAMLQFRRTRNSAWLESEYIGARVRKLPVAVVVEAPSGSDIDAVRGLSQIATEHGHHVIPHGADRLERERQFRSALEELLGNIKELRPGQPVGGFR